MAKRKKTGSGKVTEPKNKGTMMCDFHVVVSEGENLKKKKIKKYSGLVKSNRGPNMAPRENFIFGYDKYTYQGK